MIRGFKSYTCRHSDCVLKSRVEQNRAVGCVQRHIWCIGQAAKTPPFHGGNTGSIPVCITNVNLVFPDVKRKDNNT